MPYLDSMDGGGYWTPERRRVQKLGLRLFQARWKPKLESAIDHTWNRLLGEMLLIEESTLPAKHRRENVRHRYLRMGWAVLESFILNKNLQLDRFSLHLEAIPDTDKPTLPVVIVRREGAWEMSHEMLAEVRNHPQIRAISAARNYRQSPEEFVREMACSRLGKIFDPGVGDDLLSYLSRPILPTPVREAFDFDVFWKIMRCAVELGIEIGREESKDKLEPVICQGVAMEKQGTGSGLDAVSNRISVALNEMHEQGHSRPNPGKVLTWMMLEKPSRIDAPLECPSDAGLSALLAQKCVTYKIFRERVEYLRAKIWGN